MICCGFNHTFCECVCVYCESHLQYWRRYFSNLLCIYLFCLQSCCFQYVTQNQVRGNPAGTMQTCWWTCWHGTRRVPVTTALVLMISRVNLMGESKQSLYCSEIIYIRCILCATHGSFKCIFFHPDVALSVESSHEDGARALTLNWTPTNILLLSS